MKHTQKIILQFDGENEKFNYIPPHIIIMRCFVHTRMPTTILVLYDNRTYENE